VWDAQKNLTLEFSRRPRGIAIWAALKGLGRDGVRDMVDRHCRLARRIADGARAAGLEILNRVGLNQVLARAGSDAHTQAVMAYVQASGRAWFGPAVWQGRPAFRISVSSWRTGDAEADALVALLKEALRATA
jgi:glutamate/tyrosine decarboxylase-like PLP-dependent enzyme